jgi:MFS family permease
MAVAAAAPVSVHDALDGAKLTPLHWRIWLHSAMGVFLDAFDLFIIGVAMPVIARAFATSPAQTGLIAAASPLGAIVGAAVAGQIADRIGRRLVFAVDLGMFVLFALRSALAPSVGFLMLFRFLLGVAIGADYPISSSYVAELMPARVSGRMMVGALSFQAIGAVVGAVVGLALLAGDVAGDDVWRWMLAAGIVPAFVVLMLRRGAPESPRWAQAHGMTEEAAAVTRQLTGGQDIAVAAPAAPMLPARALVSRRFIRRTVLALEPWFLMDLALYSIGLFTPTILSIIDLGGESAAGLQLWLAKDIRTTEVAVVLDLFLVIGFVIALLAIDRWGRLLLQKLGFLGMTAGLLIVAAGAAGGSANKNDALIVGGFALFNIFVNAGPNSTTWTLPSELFPTSLRGSANGLAAASGKLGAAVGIFCLPVLEAAWGLSRLMVAVAAVCLLGFAITAIFGAGLETSGRALEESEDGGLKPEDVTMPSPALGAP